MAGASSHPPRLRRAHSIRKTQITDQAPFLDRLVRRLDQAQISDRRRLRRQPHELCKQPDDARLARQVERFQASCTRVGTRHASVPVIHYNNSLPIAVEHDGIKAAIAVRQAATVTSETDSGETTQLPKVCLGLGYGIHGLVGHTQPRRLATYSAVTWVMEGIDTSLGTLVDCRVRFEDQSDGSTLAKLMTNDILLTKTQHDRYLEHYDMLIVDEAYERSLNIGFLLGYLKTLLYWCPDPELIVTSATVGLEHFSQHSDSALTIEVSGCAYPVKT